MGAELGATYLPGGLPIGETLVGVGAVASRPSANSDLTPRLWFDSTTGLLYVDDSGTWYNLIPGLQATNVYLGDVEQRITQTNGGSGWWSLRRNGEVADRCRLLDTGVAVGGGATSLDTVLRRISAGVFGVYDATIAGNLIQLRVATTPSNANDATSKAYVDGVVDDLSGVSDAATARTNLGLGTAAVQAVGDFVQADDGGKEQYDSHGGAAVGATETIDLANGNVHRCILDENVTFTFTGSTASVACSFTLILVQDGTGTNSVTWPASVDWAAATAPTIASGANDVTVLTFLTVDNGTTWYGFLAGSDMG